MRSSRYAEALAERENLLEEGGSQLNPAQKKESRRTALRGLGPTERLLLSELAVRGVTSDSRRLAGYVQLELVSKCSSVHHACQRFGCKESPFLCVARSAHAGDFS